MPRLTADQWAEIRAEREATGVSLRDLGDKYGISAAAVLKRAQKEGWGDGADVGATIRRKVNEKVNGVVNTVNQKRKAEILDQAAERGAQLIRQHQQDWEAHRQIFGAVSTDFESGKHAKISAEMLKIRHDGERSAYGLNEPSTGGEVKIVIERETISR